MTDIRQITLGGRTFDVPPLPLRINMEVYPICQRLSNGELVGRFAEAVAAGAAFSSIAIAPEEMTDLSEVAFLAARAGSPDLTRDEFFDLPIGPTDLLNAFFAIRYQTGVWLSPATEGDNQPGEAPRAKKRRTSTSSASSPA